MSDYGYFAGSAPTPQPEASVSPPSSTRPYRTLGRLGFRASLQSGFRLIPTCWSVLAAEPSLLLVPLVVFAVTVAMAIGYAGLLGGVDHVVTANKYATALRVFPIAALCSAVGVIGRAVIVAAATERLQGRRPTLSSAWVTTLGQLPRLVLFGIVFAAERTITGLLRGDERWSPGTLAADAIDRAWDFATYLAIPVVLFEDLSVFAAIKRSGRLVAGRWGTQLTARSVMSLSLFVVSLPFLGLALLVCLSSTVVGVGLLVLVLIGTILVSAALNGVLSAAMYRFAITGLVVPGFHESDMWAAFGRR